MRGSLGDTHTLPPHPIPVTYLCRPCDRRGGDLLEPPFPGLLEGPPGVSRGLFSGALRPVASSNTPSEEQSLGLGGDLGCGGGQRPGHSWRKAIGLTPGDGPELPRLAPPPLKALMASRDDQALLRASSLRHQVSS